MKKIILIIMCLFCVGCVHDRWSTQDKVLETTWQVVHAVDWGTTLDIADHPYKFHEHNPLLGEYPSRSEVNTYMATTAILHSVITNYIPQKCRKTWQMITITTTSACAINNFNIGLRLAF
jgi:hypothetical protein